MAIVCVSGSRSINNPSVVFGYLDAYHSQTPITELVHGGARGVDRLARMWAEGKGIAATEFEPDWDAYGKAAGPIRNEIMAEYAERVLVIWDGKSKGTAQCAKYAQSIGKHVTLIVYGSG